MFGCPMSRMLGSAFRIRLETSLRTKVVCTGRLSMYDWTAASAVQSYIDNLPVQTTLVLNEVSSLILNADPSILDIGQPNIPLNSIYIWRSRADGTRYSRTLIGDYTPALGERLVTENIANAIQLTQAATN